MQQLLVVGLMQQQSTTVAMTHPLWVMGRQCIQQQQQRPQETPPYFPHPLGTQSLQQMQPRVQHNL
jgi:hypothetical protein